MRHQVLRQRFNNKVLDQQRQQTHHAVLVALAETMDPLKEQKPVVMIAGTQLFKVVAVWVKELLEVRKQLGRLNQHFK
jgi:hypothetical protein